MKKAPYQGDDLWTKWFFPFSMYLPSLYRKKFKHRKPSPEKLARHQKYTSILSATYFLAAWSLAGLAIFQYMEYERASSKNLDEKLEERKQRNIRKLSNNVTIEDIEKGKRIIDYKWENGGFVKYDRTQDIKDYLAGKRTSGEDYDQYKDEDYLARRSNMSKDDPKFDADFWGAYYKRIDKKHSTSANDKISDYFGGKQL